ncbi:MAG: hypothetical protein J6K48_03850 [Lachnospiraceae bacterium]|nr:hypothetical protein [Lachnospiraceae bacterium]
MNDDTVQGRISLLIDGFVALTAKSDLITYYEKVLHARVARGQGMYIDETAAGKERIERNKNV